MAGDRGRIDGDAQLLVDRELHAHATEQLHRGGDVVQVRDVADLHRPISQQGRCKNRQHGVLGAGDLHLAIQRLAAGNQDFCH